MFRRFPNWLRQTGPCPTFASKNGPRPLFIFPRPLFIFPALLSSRFFFLFRFISYLLSLGIAASVAFAFQEPSKSPANEPSLDELRAAKESVEVQGHTLKMTVSLYRDFMPVSPPDGRPLEGIIQLMTADLKTLPKGIDVDTVWVIKGDKLWISTPVKHEQKDSKCMEVSMKDGPKWEPGSFVDVVIRVRNKQGGSNLMRTSTVRIGRSI